MTERIVYIKQAVDDPETGLPVKLRGYAAVYNQPSEVLYEHGLPEILAPGSFDEFLASRRRPNFILNHLGLDGFLVGSDAIRLWSDSYGLAFEVEHIRMTDQAIQAVAVIGRGQISACSWKLAPGAKWERNVELVRVPRFIERFEDEVEMHVIRNIEAICEFGPCSAAAYPQTGVWLASADPNRLPGHLLSLERNWQKSAPAHICNQKQ